MTDINTQANYQIGKNNMKYAGIIYNDFAAASGVSLTFFTQGCPHHCPGCHNPETWDPQKGKDFTLSVLKDIDIHLLENGINRNFCMMGGEPMAEYNLELTAFIFHYIKTYYPQIKIYLWSGYTYEELLKRNKPIIKYILSMTNVLIDGPYIEKLKNTTLKMRGSSNQKILTF